MKTLIYIFTFVLTSTAIAQNNNSVAFEIQKLQQAKAYNDEAAMVNTIYALIAMEGPQSSYKDSLAYMYFSQRNYVSCFLVTNDLLKSKPDNIELLEMSAVSLESMGGLAKAKETYTTLFSKSNNSYHAYKLAGLEYRMNENEKAYVTIKNASQLPDNGDLKITFQVNENYNQNIDLKAAIFYLKGLIAVDMKKKEEARASFEHAIQLSPDFVLAKSKLEVLDALETE